MKLREIATRLGGEVVGDPDAEIARPGKIEDAAAGEITFLSNPKYETYLAGTKATAVIVSRGLDHHKYKAPGRSFVVVADAYVGFMMCLKAFESGVRPFPAGIHPSAVIAESAKLGSGVSVGALCVVGERVRIGAGTTLQPGVIVAADSAIGEACMLEPHVTIRHGSILGNRVVVRAGCVIGAEGFGFAKTKERRYEHIPQLGIAVIEDDVDIGSNSTICRATAGETRIGRGTILDCHVHIAHNCVVGENGAFACGVAIAGSTKIGKDVTLAGQVGIAGHAKIADGVTILAQSGIAGSHSKPGEVFFGSPATERKDALRRWAAVGRLPKLLEDFRKLRDEIQRIQERLGDGGKGPPE